MIWTLAFWKGAAERAIKTFAQVLVGFFVVGSTGLIGFDWATALSLAGAAAVASVLTSIGNAEFTAGTDNSPVVVNNVFETPEIPDGTGAHRAEATVHDD